jgi:hypothetical protein
MDERCNEEPHPLIVDKDRIGAETKRDETTVKNKQNRNTRFSTKGMSVVALASMKGSWRSELGSYPKVEDDEARMAALI